jgi:hypothetical protein
MRCPYIPQDWISEQMSEMLGSPIVWIEQIHATRQAIAYVTKYVTKAPAQWGNKKRYWQSRNWDPTPEADKEDWKSYDGRVTVQRVSWADITRQREQQGWTAEITPEGWWRWWRPGRHALWKTTLPRFPILLQREDVPHAQPP